MGHLLRVCPHHGVHKPHRLPRTHSEEVHQCSILHLVFPKSFHGTSLGRHWPCFWWCFTVLRHSWVYQEGEDQNMEEAIIDSQYLVTHIVQHKIVIVVVMLITLL